MAYGQSDAFMGFGLAEWDTAAGEAIVEAGGGTVSRVDVGTGAVLIAAAPDLAAQLTDLVTAAARLPCDPDDTTVVL